MDKAETDEKVWLLNARAPKKLSEISKKLEQFLLLILQILCLMEKRKFHIMKAMR